MRVLVTGGAGFIGSHIADALLARGDAVLIVDDLSSGRPANIPAHAQFMHLDIRDGALVELAARFRPDAVVHAAAQASVPASMADPRRDASVNLLGGLAVREAALAAGARRFVYLTTGGALYGECAAPATEETPPRPASIYGLTKWSLECALRLLPSGALTLATLRLANVYGPRQHAAAEAGVVAAFAERMLDGGRVTIHGDGEQSRDFIHVDDVSRAALLALDHPDPLTLNIGSGAGTSINSLFRLMAAATYHAHPALHADPRPGDIRHSVLDVGRAGRLLGWRPCVSLEAGLRATIAWMTKEQGTGGEATCARCS